MDVREIRELVRRPSSRSSRLVVAAALLLAVPIIWSVRQSRLTREALDRATSAEQTATQARSDVQQARAQFQGQPPKDPAIQRSRHDDPEEIARVKKLYEEIDNLTEFRDRVDQTLRTERFYVPKKGPAPQ
jgi:hypothetical protein